MQPHPDDVIVIDLGDRHGSAGDWPDGGPSRPRRRRPRRRLPGLVSFGLIAAAVIAGVAAAAPPRPLISEPLWHVDRSMFAVTGEYVYLFEESGALTAIAVRTGQPAWQLDLHSRIGGLTELSDGLMAVLTMDNAEPPVETTTKIIDARAGVVVGEVPGTMIGAAVGSDVAVFQRDLPPDPECGEVCFDTVGVNVRTTTEVWRLPQRPDARTVTQYNGSAFTGIGVVDTRGHFVRYDLTTGQPLSEVDAGSWVHRQLTDEGLNAGNLSLLADHLVGFRVEVSDVGTQTIAVSATETTTGASWTATVAATASGSDKPAFLYDCGRWVCVYDGAQTTMLDLATGDQVDSRPGWLAPLSHTDLIVWTQPPTESGMSVVILLDPTTGTVTDRVPGGMVQLIERPDRPPLMVVSGPPERGSDLYAIDRRGRARVVDTLGAVIYCLTANGALVCVDGTPDGAEGLTAWALPPIPDDVG